MANLSIVIVNYNTKDLILDCLKSLKSGGSTIELEIIVIDNGSNDGSLNALRKYKLENSKLNISIIDNKNNLGYSRANNQGIKKSTGKYVLLLNSDTKVEKGALNKLFEFADKTPDAGVIGAKLINSDKSTQKSVRQFPTLTNAVKEYWLGMEGSFEFYIPNGNKESEVDCVAGAAFLITPKARKKVGLLDEKYFFYFEDIDYCRRVRKVGLKTYYLPSAKILHLKGESGKEIVEKENQWRRLNPSSKIYHGVVKHYLIFIVLWLSQKIRKDI